MLQQMFYGKGYQIRVQIHQGANTLFHVSFVSFTFVSFKIKHCITEMSLLNIKMMYYNKLEKL